MRFATVIRTILLILTSDLLNSSLQANAYWTRVFLRIEGTEKTIFEGTVLTTGHIVTTKSGGTHECDGTNNGAHTAPGATIISAIDDSVSTWNGTYYKGIRDYFITSINRDPPTDDGSWGLLVGYKFAEKGGCQTRVAADDRVLVASGAFAASAFLELTANKQSIPVNGEVTFTVVDGKDRKPVASATVTAGKGEPTGTTGDKGEPAKIKFGKAGVYKYKAEKKGTIRSNEVTVTVTTTVASTSTNLPPAQTGCRHNPGCCD